MGRGAGDSLHGYIIRKIAVHDLLSLEAQHTINRDKLISSNHL
jgi:hypothetical protein